MSMFTAQRKSKQKSYLQSSIQNSKIYKKGKETIRKKISVDPLSELSEVLDYSKRIGLSERKNNKNSADGEIYSNNEYDDDVRRSRILGDWDAINYPKSIQAAALKQAKTNLIEQDRELLKIVGRGSSLFTSEEIENQSSWRTFNPFTYVKAIGNWNDKRQNTVRAKGSERWRRASGSGGRFLDTLAEENNNEYNDDSDLMSSCSKSDRPVDASQKWGPYFRKAATGAMMLATPNVGMVNQKMAEREGCSKNLVPCNHLLEKNQSNVTSNSNKENKKTFKKIIDNLIFVRDPRFEKNQKYQKMLMDRLKKEEQKSQYDDQKISSASREKINSLKTWIQVTERISKSQLHGPCMDKSTGRIGLDGNYLTKSNCRVMSGTNLDCDQEHHCNAPSNVNIIDELPEIQSYTSLQSTSRANSIRRSQSKMYIMKRSESVKSAKSQRDNRRDEIEIAEPAKHHSQTNPRLHNRVSRSSSREKPKNANKSPRHSKSCIDNPKFGFMTKNQRDHLCQSDKSAINCTTNAKNGIKFGSKNSLYGSQSSINFMEQMNRKINQKMNSSEIQAKRGASERITLTKKKCDNPENCLERHNTTNLCNFDKSRRQRMNACISYCSEIEASRQQSWKRIVHRNNRNSVIMHQSVSSSNYIEEDACETKMTRNTSLNDNVLKVRRTSCVNHDQIGNCDNNNSETCPHILCRLYLGSQADREKKTKQQTETGSLSSLSSEVFKNQASIISK